MKEFIILILLLLSLRETKAQETYILENNIPVNDNDVILQNPWSGGLNSPQVNFTDINGDGFKDYFLFERTSGKVKILMGTGQGNHIYQPGIEGEVPPVTGWVLLRDVNDDNLPDMLTSHPLGMKIYLNTTTQPEELSWRPYNSGEVILSKNVSGSINIKIEENDIPAIEDIDGDGDYDILNFKFLGNTIEYHKNISNTPDTLIFELTTDRWGEFEECSCGDFNFNEEVCNTAGGRTEHATSRALLAIDFDGDGDKDIAISEEDCPQIYLLENTGSEVVAKMGNPSWMFPEPANPANLYSFPVATASKDEQGHVSDLFITTNTVNNNGFVQDYENAIWHYTFNSSTNRFHLQEKNHLIKDMIDVGENSSPAFFDLDNDGDQDMIIGSFGKFTSNGMSASMAFYENTGNAIAPEFTLRESFWNAFLYTGLFNIKPQFVDVDNNGNTDLVFSATSATTFETSVYIALNNSFWHFDPGPAVKSNITLQYQENILAHDFDKDGFADLIVGKSGGNIQFFENKRKKNQGIFEQKSNTYLGFGFNQDYAFASFGIADLNNNGSEDLVIARRDGKIEVIYDLSGKAEPLSLEIQGNLPHDPGTRLAPRFANLFHEDMPVLIMGNQQGGLHVYRNSQAIETPLVETGVKPTFVIPEDDGAIIQSEQRILFDIINPLGQQIVPLQKLPSGGSARFDFNGLASGIYLVRIQTAQQVYRVEKIMVNR